MLLLLLLGSIWLVVASVTIALAVAASKGDAMMNAAIPPCEPPKLTICRSCHAVIGRRPAGEECPACGHGMVASPARAAFARTPS